MDENRQAAVKGTIFSTWVVLGLFIDGWAHNADKPETFWTPWHGVLYSGFIVGAIVFARDRRRQQREGTTASTDPLLLAGFALFGLAGVGDAVWHTLLGVEEDVAALLSPTHLALMLGGLLLIGGPLRRRHHDATGPRAGWREAYPDVVAITLAVAVVAFFVQFLSPFHDVGAERYGAAAGELGEYLGVASILLTNGLLLAGVAYAATRVPRLPTGTFTVLLGATAGLSSALETFEGVELTVAALAAGVAADVLAHRRAGVRVVLLATPAVLWLTWFAIYQLRWGLEWPAEYWSGVTVLAVLTGWGLDVLLAAGSRAAAPAGVRADAPADAPAPAAVPPGVHLGVEPQVQAVDRGAPTPLAGRS